LVTEKDSGFYLCRTIQCPCRGSRNRRFGFWGMSVGCCIYSRTHRCGCSCFWSSHRSRRATAIGTVGGSWIFPFVTTKYTELFAKRDCRSGSSLRRSITFRCEGKMLKGCAPRCVIIAMVKRRRLVLSVGKGNGSSSYSL